MIFFCLHLCVRVIIFFCVCVKSAHFMPLLLFVIVSWVGAVLPSRLLFLYDVSFFFFFSSTLLERDNSELNCCCFGGAVAGNEMQVNHLRSERERGGIDVPLVNRKRRLFVSSPLPCCTKGLLRVESVSLPPVVFQIIPTKCWCPL